MKQKIPISSSSNNYFWSPKKSPSISDSDLNNLAESLYQNIRNSYQNEKNIQYATEHLGLRQKCYTVEYMAQDQYRVAAMRAIHELDGFCGKFQANGMPLYQRLPSKYNTHDPHAKYSHTLKEIQLKPRETQMRNKDKLITKLIKSAQGSEKNIQSLQQRDRKDWNTYVGKCKKKGLEYVEYDSYNQDLVDNIKTIITNGSYGELNVDESQHVLLNGQDILTPDNKPGPSV